MDEDRKEITRRILDFTLEIIYLLTGEDYTIVKKTSGDCVTPIIHLQESGGWGRSHFPITDPPPHSLIHDQKILELTHKMMELLTGEVPIRCQDVAVYFSMEEWEYIEGHRDLYEDDMMEDHRPLKSQDGFSRRNSPERCPHPLYSQDCPGEDLDVLEDHQGEDMIDIKIEVIDDEDIAIRSDQLDGCNERNHLYSHNCTEEDHNVRENHQGEDLTGIKVEIEEEERMMDDHPCVSDVTEIPVDITTENHSMNVERILTLSLNYEVEDEDAVPHCSGENPITLNVHPGLHSTDLSYNPPNHEEPSLDRSQITTSGSQQGGILFQYGEQFPNSSGHCTHTGIHTGEKPFSCSECGNCFMRKSNLVRHEIIHTGKKPYSCKVCGKCFTYISNLVTHERSHTGEKPFSCSLCGRSFTKKCNLLKHQKIHTGEKPYSCSECDKCFIDKSHLVRHLRCHTGEKPYPCSECGKRFTHRSNLVKHVRIHTGEKPYSCLECGRCFSDQSSHIKHKRSHTEKKPS